MNTDHILPIGTRVRSYDFPGVTDCYIEGVIEGYGGDVFPSDAHYRVRADKRVWNGIGSGLIERERIVYPPFMGMFGKPLVEKIDG